MNVPTVRELIERNARQWGGRTAFQIRNADNSWRRITFQQTAALVKNLQAKLLTLGFVKGDRVAIISENRPEWPIAYLAVTALGGVAVPLDAMLSPEDLRPLIEDSGAKIIVLSQKYVDYFGNLQKVLMEGVGTLLAAENELPVGQLDDLAAIVYTSGTTGVPKGVMLTQRNIMFDVAATVAVIPINQHDNFLSVLPLHHTFETTAGFFGAFYVGATITYAESLKSHALLKNMQETGVTIMCGVPLLYQLFYDGIRREVEEKGKQKAFAALLSVSRFFLKVVGVNIGKKLFAMIHKKFGGKIRFLVSGGAALDRELARNFELFGFTILQGYGLTESSPILTCCTPKQNRLGSPGRPIPGVQIRISGTEEIGEILAYGPNIMKGYYRQPEMTKRVLVNGWLHTGDLGYFDDDGFLFITGRSKDVIVTAAGVNVYPDEIEAVINRIPGVKESCVLGVKAQEGVRKGSEEVMAVIVTEREQETIAQEIKTLNKKLPDFKRIARFVVRREDLPKTRILKIKRFEIKKELGI